MTGRFRPTLFIRRLRIRTKIFLSNVIVILLLALSIGSAATLAARAYIEANARELALHVIEQYASNLEHHVNDFLQSTLYLLHDNWLAETVPKRIESADRSDSAKEALDFVLSNQVSSRLFQHANSNAHIRSIVVMYEPQQVYWWERPTFKENFQRHSEQPRSIAQAGAAKLQEAGRSVFWSSSLRGTDEIALSQVFTDINKINRQLGVIVYHLDRAYFLNLLLEGSMIQADDLLIMNERSEVLLAGRSVSQADAELDFARLGGQGPISRKVDAGGHSSLLLAYTSPDTGWTVVCLIPMSRLLGGIGMLNTIIALICVLFLFVAVAVAFWFSVGTTRDIRSLERTMRRVEEGDLTVRAALSGRDEIGALAVRFNAMIARTQELIAHVSAERLAKQQAEYAVLLAQINPHFLYNTLGTIKWVAHRKGDREIEKMTADLIGLLRASIRHVGGKLPLAEELAHVRHYLDLQQIGYGDAFKAIYDIDERLLPCLVPSFILQPLVENAIMHGLEISQGNGKIYIEAQREGEDMRLVVADNGVGMEESAAADLLTTMQDGTRGDVLRGIGVRQVQERIAAMYGARYGVTIETAPGCGMRVEIRLPVEIGEERSEADVQDARRGG